MLMPKKPKRQRLEQRKAYCRPCKEVDGWCPEHPKLPQGFQQSAFTGQVRGGVDGCCELLGVGILYF